MYKQFCDFCGEEMDVLRTVWLEDLSKNSKTKKDEFQKREDCCEKCFEKIKNCLRTLILKHDE